MTYSNIPSAQAVVYHCKQRSIENIVISPGSRNAPLSLGFTEDPFFKCYSIVDERSAAFFALGMAQQSRSPAVLICTSGSALLNYYPAIAEAFYSDIPLIVISADRPPYKIDIGDGQTIRQEGIFSNHIGFAANLKLDVIHAVEELKQWSVLDKDVPEQEINRLQEEVSRYNDAQLNQAFQKAVIDSFPVHINVPFEEPLYGLETDLYRTPEVEKVKNPKRLPDPEDMDELVDTWSSSKRKLIIVGVQFPDLIDDDVLQAFADDPSVAVLTETTSNMRRLEFVNSIDSVLAPIELAQKKTELFQELRPELVISFGGLIVSKKIKAFLRLHRPAHHWHIDPKKAFNTFQALSKHIRLDPNTFFTDFFPKVSKVKSDYAASWYRAKKGFREQREHYLEKVPFSDLLAFDRIFKYVPPHYQLQLANSSTVRYSQLFDIDPGHWVFCNRGTSGIDGSTSTAVGAASIASQPILLLSGDLSFLYDINGLWNEYLRSDFRIIVINNGGGGIFRILPGRKENEAFERYFETPHQAQFNKICEAYGLEHLEASDLTSLEQAFQKFFSEGRRPKLLEIRTPRTLNDKILLQYFEFISSNLYT